MNLDNLIKDLTEFYSCDKTGHGIEHTMRVYSLAIDFAKKEKCNIDIVSLASLLHDCDDYKLVGFEKAKSLANTHYFLNKYYISKDVQDAVIEIIQTMGYSNCLDGIRCKTIEGKIVSDADMCDAIGSIGIVRTIEYNNSLGRLFFDPCLYPLINQSKETYQNKNKSTCVNHFFEKLLLVKKFMLTNEGKKESQKRYQIMVDFLTHFFIENHQEQWLEYLNKFIKGSDL